jgi:hypothetical protein
MKNAYIVGILLFLALSSVYYIFGNLESFFTTYYFVMNDLLSCFLFYFIAKTGRLRIIKNISWLMLSFSGFKTIYNILLINMDTYEYLQTIESMLWSVIFALYALIIIFMIKKWTS